MSSTAAERPTGEENGEERPVSCFLIIREACVGRQSTSNNRNDGSSNDAKCKSRTKALLLGIGFICIVICFIFAALGYMKFRTCPVGENCERDSQKFSEAQNYRLTAALLFIVGICLIIMFVWLVKREGGTTTHERTALNDVMVSDVTAEGLLKTPAPELSHPLSQIHRIVYEIPTEEKLADANDLPQYESAIELEKGKDEGISSVKPDGKIITIRGVQMESVCTQVDEDDINPPPTYLQAIEIEIESQEELPLQERDNG